MKGTKRERPHILICDDSWGVRNSLKLILDREYDLAFVTNGEEAIRYVKAHRPDLLISDVKMPRMGGLQALPKIKRAHRRIRVLIVTGYESSDVAQEAAQAGADDYLTKPFAAETILAKVRALLSL